MKVPYEFHRSLGRASLHPALFLLDRYYRIRYTETMYTIRELAGRIGISERGVRKRVERLKLPKRGRDYVLTEAEAELVINYRRKSYGRA